MPKNIIHCCASTKDVISATKQILRVALGRNSHDSDLYRLSKTLESMTAQVPEARPIIEGARRIVIFTTSRRLPEELAALSYCKVGVVVRFVSMFIAY